MKLIDLPDFAIPYKTKGYDIRLTKNSYQLFKISSKRVEGKSYPVIQQEYIGTIDPVKGLIPKKKRISKSQKDNSMLEYGLSNFIFKRYKRILLRSLFNCNSDSIYLIKMAIIKFMYGHTEERFIKLSFIGQDIEFPHNFDAKRVAIRIDKLVTKITSIFNNLIYDQTDRDYLIIRLRNIKCPTNNSSKISYPADVLAIFDKYGITYDNR